MSDDDLFNLDLRTFQLLSAVARAESFTRAAEVMGLSQSVVSYNIDKLRQVFDDPLFVRIAGKTLPTERCRAIMSFSDAVIVDFQRLRTSGRFDPTKTTEKIVIACNYYERMLIVPRIAAALARQAPNMQLEIVDASGTGHEKLLNREADLLIGPFQRGDAAFYARTLASDSYACLLDPGHSCADAPLSLEHYLALDHILVTYGGRWRSTYITALEKLGHSHRAVIRIPSPAGIEELVRGSHLVATLPSALARKIGHGLRVIPFPVGVTMSVQLVWTAEKQQSEILKWVRDLIAGTFQTGPDDLASGPK
jgi:DNA-binding transcriptional LysR family regulator